MKGRKRHIVVDILGNLLTVVVHAANDGDTTSGCQVLKQAAQKQTTIEAFSGDGKFAVLPKRWIVERTFAWLGHFRRLAKDFEILILTAENMIHIAMLKLTVANCL